MDHQGYRPDFGHPTPAPSDNLPVHTPLSYFSAGDASAPPPSPAATVPDSTAGVTAAAASPTLSAVADAIAYAEAYDDGANTIIPKDSRYEKVKRKIEMIEQFGTIVDHPCDRCSKQGATCKQLGSYTKCSVCRQMPPLRYHVVILGTLGLRMQPKMSPSLLRRQTRDMGCQRSVDHSTRDPMTCNGDTRFARGRR